MVFLKIIANYFQKIVVDNKSRSNVSDIVIGRAWTNFPLAVILMNIHRAWRRVGQ